MNILVSEQRKQMLEAAILEARDGVLITKAVPPDGAGPTIVFANDAFARISGYQPAELIGQTPRLFQGQGTDRAALDRIKAALLGAQSVREELLNYRKDGKPYWVDVSIFPIAVGGGAPTHFVSIQRDATEAKRLEREVATTERLLASVFAMLDEAISIVDDSGKFLMINPAYTRLLGWRPEDVVGRPFTIVIPEEQREEARRLLMEDGRRHSAVTLLRRDGLWAKMELSAVTMTTPDGRRYSVATLSKAADAPVEEAPRGFVELSDLEAAARSRIASNGLPTLVAGKIQLVGMDEIRRALGSRWPAVEKRVRNVAEGIIKHRLTPADVFCETDDGGYLICFANLKEEEAAFKARAIGQEIRSRLLGELPDAKVTACAAAVDIDEPAPEDPGSIAAAIEARLNQRRAELERNARAALHEAVEKGSVDAADICSAAGKRALLLARLPIDLQQAFDEAQAALGGDPALTQEVELFLLGMASEHAAAGKAIGWMVPVDYALFLNKRRTDQYMQVCRTISEQARRRLFFEIRNMPAEQGHTRIVDAVNALNQFSRGTIVELLALDDSLIDPSRCRIAMVSLDWPVATGAGPNWAERLGRLVERLHARRIRVLVRNVPAASDASTLNNLGVDLLSGDGVSAATEPKAA